VMTTSDTFEATIQHHPREATPEREEVVRLETVEEEEGIIWTSPPSPEAAFNSTPPAPEGSHASPAMPTSSATTPKGRDITPPSPSPRGDGAPAPGAQSPSTGTSFHTPPGPSREAPTPPTSRHTSGVRSSLFNSSSSGYAPILESGSESSSPDTRRVVPTAERDRRLAFWDPRPPFLALLGRRNSSGATVTPATATMGGHPTGDSPPNPNRHSRINPPRATRKPCGPIRQGTPYLLAIGGPILSPMSDSAWTIPGGPTSQIKMTKKNGSDQPYTLPRVDKDRGRCQGPAKARFLATTLQQ
jgi:hypothetical protein